MALSQDQALQAQAAQGTIAVLEAKQVQLRAEAQSDIDGLAAQIAERRGQLDADIATTDGEIQAQRDILVALIENL